MGITLSNLPMRRKLFPSDIHPDCLCWHSFRISAPLRLVIENSRHVSSSVLNPLLQLVVCLSQFILCLPALSLIAPNLDEAAQLPGIVLVRSHHTAHPKACSVFAQMSSLNGSSSFRGCRA